MAAGTPTSRPLSNATSYYGNPAGGASSPYVSNGANTPMRGSPTKVLRLGLGFDVIELTKHIPTQYFLS